MSNPDKRNTPRPVKPSRTPAGRPGTRRRDDNGGNQRPTRGVGPNRPPKK